MIAEIGSKFHNPIRVGKWKKQSERMSGVDTVLFLDDPRDLAPVARVSATLISLTTPPQTNVTSLGERPVSGFRQRLSRHRANPNQLQQCDR